MDKLVSIILPTYNGALRIEASILSVLAQAYTNWELLVIDDGSTDGTCAVVSSLAQKDSRIRYIKNETNLGIQKTLNRGIQEAKGEYIARIDDDDVWVDRDKLKQQVAFLVENTDHVLVGTGFIAVNENGKEIFRKYNTTSDKEIRSEILNKNCFTHSSVLFIKSSALSTGGYSESPDTRHIEDYELWLKLGTVGTFANIPMYGVKLVLRSESISSQNKVEQFKKSLTLIKKFKKQYPQYWQAVMFISLRMYGYRFLTMRFFRPFFSRVYTLYKNI